MTTHARKSLIEKVRLGILKDLAEGVFPMGAKLVNEEGLATQFDVSRSTVREAVSALVSGGYLERRHGSGTYVAGLPRPYHSLDTTLSYMKMIAEAGMKPDLHVLSVETRVASPVEAADLGLEQGELVRSLARQTGGPLSTRSMSSPNDWLPTSLRTASTSRSMTRSTKWA